LAPEVLGRVLDDLTDGIVVLDRESRVEYINERAGTMLGRSPAELLGQHVPTAFPDRTGGPFDRAFIEATRTGAATRIVEYYAPTERWFESWISPQGPRTAIVFRDVTDEQRAEDELQEYVDRVAEAERIVRFGVWKWHIASGRVRWSDELHHIYGLRPGAFAGTLEGFLALLHPDDRDRVGAVIARTIETFEPFAFEERILRPDGEERTLLSEGRVLVGPDGAAEALVGVCHDVTDRVRVERALGASEQRMRALIDNTPSIISVKDLEGRYLLANAEFGRAVGVTPEAAIGQHCTDLFPPEVADQQRERDRRVADGGGPVYGEAVLIRDGEPRTYRTVTFSLPDENGAPAEICTIATDVTERRERESERRERLAWEHEIASALTEGRMLVYAQPVIDVRSGERVANELLVRLRSVSDPDEILEPHAFLPQAERYGLVQSIDVWMVGQALDLYERDRLQVNLSAVTMCDADARRRIVEKLAASPEAARHLVFEITETAVATHLDAARAFAEEIAGLGCELALDDFGVGFGSFTYLRALPASCLKIDLSFVRHLTSSRDDRRVVQSILGIAHEFGLKTIAEGVEDAATLELLRELGADFVQGYHLGPPAPLQRD
jgi:PAS domain S-box-containing protein